MEQSKDFVLLGRYGTADNQQVSLSPTMRHSRWNQQPNVIKFTNTESWKVYQYHYQTQLPDLRPQCSKPKIPWNLSFGITSAIYTRCAKLPRARVPRLYGSSVQNLFHVVLLVPKFLKWFLYFWKIYALLDCNGQGPVLCCCVPHSAANVPVGYRHCRATRTSVNDTAPNKA